MTKLPPQPDDNLDHAAASILESEVPARSTVRAVNEPGRPVPAFRHRCARAGRAPRRIARWRGSDRQDRRRQGKSDSLDAVSAARAAQSGRAGGASRGRDGAVEAIRALMIAKASDDATAICLHNLLIP
jgi:hypothetical protein